MQQKKTKTAKRKRAFPARATSPNGGNTHPSNGGSTNGFREPSLDPPIEPAFGDLFPLMSADARDASLRKRAAFKDVFVLSRTHLTLSSVPALDALTQWGLDPANITYFRKEYPYPFGTLCPDTLRRRGATVLPDAELTTARLDSYQDYIQRNNLRLITIEDGGDIARMIHESPALRPLFAGGVEQTTRGTWQLQKLEEEGLLTKPVVVLSSSDVKKNYEGPRIGASSLLAVQNLYPHESVSGWRVAILGLGTIGRHMTAAFIEFGCRVTAYDPDPVVRLNVRHLGADVVKRTAEEAIAGADVIIGTAGKLTITADILARTRGHIKIASASSERVETDHSWLSQYAKRSEPLMLHPAGFPENEAIGTRHFLHSGGTVDVIFDGYPINMSKFGILSERSTDLILSFLLHCAHDVAAGTFDGMAGVVPGAADEVFRRYKLAEHYEHAWS